MEGIAVAIRGIGWDKIAHAGYEIAIECVIDTELISANFKLEIFKGLIVKCVYQFIKVFRNKTACDTMYIALRGCGNLAGA